MTMSVQPTIANALEQLHQLLETGNTDSDIADLLAALHASEVAAILESLPPEKRDYVWACVHDSMHGDVLAELGEGVLLDIVREMSDSELVAAAQNMDTDDLAEVIEDLPETLGDTIKSALSAEILDRLETNLTFDDGTAGRLISGDIISVRADISIETVRRFLHRRKDLPENTDGLFVIDRDGIYLGKLPLQNILTADDDDLVAAVMHAGAMAVQAIMPENDLAIYFEDRDLLSVAVVDETGKLLGRITVDDVVDILREQANHAVMSAAGLEDETDLFAPVRESVRSRSIWLGINLVTAFLASWVIGLFEVTLEKVVALAVLMPIVASMGGIAGSQTLALIMRGMALNQVSRSNQLWLLKKEVSIGLMNGLLWAVVIAIVAGSWFQSPMIGLIIGIAIIINLVAAAFAGFAVPVTLKRMGIDPAISAPVVLTTVTDVVGFFAFLGLATVLLV